AERAVAGIDIVIIGYVIAGIALGGGLERHQPESSDAEPMQVIQAAHQPLEVTNTITIGIHVGADRQAINHRVLVPEIVDHAGPRFVVWSSHLGRVEGVVWMNHRGECAHHGVDGATGRSSDVSPEPYGPLRAAAPSRWNPTPRMVLSLGDAP